MPYKDPAKRTEAVRRHRRKRGEQLERLAVDVQGAADLPDPPSRELLLKALGVQAREGNVPAIRLLLEEYRRDGNSDEKPQRSKIDELAGRRASRAG